MSMQDPFVNPGFSLADLTAAINKLPNRYGRAGSLGIFKDKGIATRTLIVDEKNGVLNLLPSKPVGAAGTANINGSRTVRSFVVPHIPLDDQVLPQDVQGVRAFGSEGATDGVTQVVNDKLAEMKAKHEITLEHLRMGAVKGIILDGDGATTLYNLYTEFGITQKSVDFLLGTSTTNVAATCREVVRHIEDNLLGETMTGIRVLVSEEFYDKLISHANVEKAYSGWAAAQQVIGGDMRSGFAFGGLVFEEYRGKSSLPSGVTQRFIAANEGHAVPMGTMNAFQTIYAPADFNETVNTIGLPYYAKMEGKKFGRGWELHTQSNPLPICNRPGILVKCHTSN